MLLITLTSLRPSSLPRDLDCRSGKKALRASMREVRSGSLLVTVVRSAQDKRALRRLSSRCLAVLERRCTGAASSSGSLHTSRAACTVCRRLDTGGDVNRDTKDSNIALAAVIFWRPITRDAHIMLTKTHFSLCSLSRVAKAYNQIKLFHNNIAFELWVVNLEASNINHCRYSSDRWPFDVTIVIELIFHELTRYGLFGIHSHRIHTVTDNTQFRKWQNATAH